MRNHEAFTSLALFAGQVPNLLVCLVGFLVALVQHRRAPRAAPLAAIGFAILGLIPIETFLVGVLAPRMAEAGDTEQMVAVLGINSALVSFVHAVGLALVLAAVFVGRPSAASRTAPA